MCTVILRHFETYAVGLIEDLALWIRDAVCGGITPQNYIEGLTL